MTRRAARLIAGVCARDVHPRDRPVRTPEPRGLLDPRTIPRGERASRLDSSIHRLRPFRNVRVGILGHVTTRRAVHAGSLAPAEDGSPIGSTRRRGQEACRGSRRDPGVDRDAAGRRDGREGAPPREVVGLRRGDESAEGLGRDGDVEALRVDHARRRRTVRRVGVLPVVSPSIGPSAAPGRGRPPATGPHRRHAILRNDADVAPAREDRPRGWTRDERRDVGLRARRHHLLAARHALHARTRPARHHRTAVPPLPTQHGPAPGAIPLPRAR